jgi:hypothetical protein
MMEWYYIIYPTKKQKKSNEIPFSEGFDLLLYSSSSAAEKRFFVDNWKNSSSVYTPHTQREGERERERERVILLVFGVK